MPHQRSHSRTSKKGKHFKAGRGGQATKFLFGMKKETGQAKDIEREQDFEEDYRGAKLEIKDIGSKTSDRFHVYIDGKLAYVDSDRKKAFSRGKKGIDSIREEQYKSV